MSSFFKDLVAQLLSKDLVIKLSDIKPKYSKQEWVGLYQDKLKSQTLHFQDQLREIKRHLTARKSYPIESQKRNGYSD